MAILILCLLAFTAPVLASCQLISLDWDINDGFDTDDYVAPNYEFVVSATAEQITIKLSNVGDYGVNGKLAALPIYQYFYSETAHGLADNTKSAPIYIDDYACGTSAEYTINRYIQDVDGIYLKYYVLDEKNNVIVGPMFCTEIEAKYQYEDPIIPRSKKGIMCENLTTEMVTDLGCSYTEMNMWIDNMFVPNEVYEDGVVKELVYEEGVNEYGVTTITRDDVTEEVDYIDYNGKRYYFRLDSIAYYDTRISYYTKRNIKVTLIVLLNNVADKYKQPYFITYPATEGSENHVQFNTSNRYGAGYWGAFMEFLGNRYSQSATSNYGLVQSYVLGNEIDMASSWNNIVGKGQAALTLENYIEEYERLMRIANQALKKYYALNKVLISVTHHWSSRGEEYAPKDIIDYMTRKTLAQGNYDYGLAIHPYGKILSSPTFWASDVNVDGLNGSLNTSAITWTNLEVMQLYLEQSSKLYNGQIRDVYLTEGGVASTSSGLSQNQTSKNQQAAGVAYAYYKASQLSCIKAFIYYRLVDHHGDGTFFGLVSDFEGVNKKPAYTLFKYIDTQYSFEVSRPYLDLISWTTTSGWQSTSHGTAFGDVNDYKDTMALVPSRFDWNLHWNETLIICRHITEEFVQ